MHVKDAGNSNCMMARSYEPGTSSMLVSLALDAVEVL